MAKKILKEIENLKDLDYWTKLNVTISKSVIEGKKSENKETARFFYFDGRFKTEKRAYYSVFFEKPKTKVNGILLIISIELNQQALFKKGKLISEIRKTNSDGTIYQELNEKILYRRSMYPPKYPQVAYSLV